MVFNDGYIQTLPPHQLTLCELHREVTRLAHARHTLPLGAARDTAIGRMWQMHQVRAHRMTVLALAAGYQLT
ncbi:MULTISPECIES: hypothetical protein [Pseudonocardia]|uniref:Uncharacterized protein n=2 Tax=Pseudonocardia TaxID=1847 RepID=A0A1Y2MNS8_PSEAH|nr:MULTISPECIES: hypothetical protein [Pseudonocardia]OSY36108.1 hypothetical protein BG845_05623 [Pseudonocardia autotrophica]TDN77590.1 hypothetical protein C8E95_6839 [Pseudonocardia autotrophica]